MDDKYLNFRLAGHLRVGGGIDTVPRSERGIDLRVEAA